MTKSTITREESVQAIFDLKVGYRLEFADIEILKRVARMALAAMDGESWCLPLDYLQGHKDGLEWAAQLAEANHPQTGDWLYDDPIELAKAIRKGPDMPPVQPVADSEPVIVVGDDGGDALSYRRLIQSFEPGTKLYRHAQPAKSLELAGWQFKSVNGDWLGLIDEHGKNQAVREGCEVREVFATADGVNDRDNVRREHAEWSQATFGNVGPVGPLKHLSKEALEAAEQPGDLSEWADMQFLLWDAQRRAGITDDQITQAMIDKLAVNKQREWPEPKDGEPRLHIKEQPAPAFPDFDNVLESLDYEVRCNAWESEHVLKACQATYDACRAAMLQELQKSAGTEAICRSDENVQVLNTIKATPALGSLPKTDEVQNTNSPVIPDGYVMVPVEPNGDMLAAAQDAYGETDGDIASTLRAAMLAAAQQEGK